MWVYNFLSNIKFLSKYVYKVIFVSTIGIATPTASFAIYILFVQPSAIDLINMIYLLFAFTLLGIMVTIWLMTKLTAPISLAQLELNKYIKTKEVPELPTHYKDEMGLILKDLKRRAVAINKLVTEKNDFTAMLSHDLRSPIISIIGLLKLIKSQPDSEQAAYYCTKAEEFGYHQLKLMESITSLLNEENLAREAPKKVNVNLSKFLAESLDQFELTLKNKQLAISKNIPAHIHVNVEPYSFSQVIANLLHNAIKFSKIGDQIELNASNGGSKVKISIKDQGIGFNLENPTVLFDRFTKERKRGTQGEPTNGLGLYLSKKIIEKHEGQILAKSDGNNKGAIFEILIPV